MIRLPALRLGRDERGTTLVEFAFVGPILIMMMMAIFDIGYQLYTRSILQGEVQKAGRDSSLEGGKANGVALDQKITDQVQRVAKNANVAFTRKAYRTFSDAAAAKAEEFTDNNGNGSCDGGEPFVDSNGDGQWNADGAKQGQGDAKDVVLYTARMTYPRLFPMAGLLGWPTTVDISATTVLINQPYSQRANYTNVASNC